MIPYGRQSVDEGDIEAVVDVLRSAFLTQGQAIPAFERAVADRCGVAEGVAVSSGTAALHLACAALDIGPGDLVWTSPLTFVASANCALYCGADVDFVDVEADTGNLCAKQLATRLESAADAGRLPKAIILVHYAGRPADRVKIAALADEYGVALIEDAAHALGAVDSLGHIGDGRTARLTTFSFHPVKIVTTGEGGLLTTNDLALAARLRRLRSHGVERDVSALKAPKPGDWYYEQHELGFNYRMTDIQAALGLSQLRRLESFVQRRRELAARYHDKLTQLPVGLPPADPGCLSAWHLYVIHVAERARVFAALREQGIGVQVHYMPVHLHPYYRKRFGFREGDFPVAEHFYHQAISLPLYPDLTDEQQDIVIQTLEQVL
ncbi:UDP-4-amino-4,6-dideoxy-N-acetyl-beta-L-altrosamine transaminase [Mangrovitalea sediminis]|uniref:UDP-4-amino-4, 6-dideoxy-N-acetyl-beta-L-altrosamine transaminase n=1 Tax=Mangrovitalea sediminis TaxID=1982043 RepID=UPI000BE5A327|nr:UDP-4-amino-4,6-dideoxy-N-acetyl-beta-L-altrosamine transaminase [Mangrovitalea sediminis]